MTFSNSVRNRIQILRTLFNFRRYHGPPKTSQGVPWPTYNQSVRRRCGLPIASHSGGCDLPISSQSEYCGPPITSQRCIGPPITKKCRRQRQYIFRGIWLAILAKPELWDQWEILSQYVICKLPKIIPSVKLGLPYTPTYKWTRVHMLANLQGFRHTYSTHNTHPHTHEHVQ